MPEAGEIVLTTGYGTRAILSFTMKTHLVDLAPNYYTIVLMPIDDQGTAMLSVNTTVFLPGQCRHLNTQFRILNPVNWESTVNLLIDLQGLGSSF